MIVYQVYVSDAIILFIPPLRGGIKYVDRNILKLSVNEVQYGYYFQFEIINLI